MRDVEKLAKEMRERALAQDFDAYQHLEIEKRREQRRGRIENLKKLYFNAGRWAGGARDHTARMAFEQINAADNSIE